MSQTATQTKPSVHAQGSLNPQSKSSRFKTVTAEVDPSKVVAHATGNQFSTRIDYGNWNGMLNSNLTWGVITAQSSVFISISEAGEGDVDFVGDAVYTVHNIAPYDGGVHFRAEIDWSSPIRFLANFLVINP